MADGVFGGTEVALAGLGMILIIQLCYNARTPLFGRKRGRIFGEGQRLMRSIDMNIRKKPILDFTTCMDFPNRIKLTSILFLIGVLNCIVSLPLLANTIIVPNDAPTIQGGINLASPGDTVLVDCGNYFEYGIELSSGIVLRSITGDPECVMINGLFSATVISCNNVDSTTVIEGFTITGGNYPSGAGINCALSSPKIINNVINNNNYWGISCRYYSNPIIKGNYLHNNFGGINTEEFCDPVIENNILDANNPRGIRINQNSNPYVRNNTILRSSEYGVAQLNGSNASVVNNIIAFNGVGIYCNSPYESFGYNCFFSNDGGDVLGNSVPDGAGDITGINANGDSCDVSFNLFGDPNIEGIDDNQYGLEYYSICVDAGSPAYLDPDESVSDIGAIYFHQLTPLAISDVPNDQGGYLTIFWERFPADESDLPDQVLAYDAQRLVTENWVTLATVSAVQADSYQTTVSTPDVFAQGQPEPYSQYRVLAHTLDPNTFFYSKVDSAFSVDNLAPPVPVVSLIEGDDFRVIHCVDPGIPDLGEVCIFRGTEAGFEPEEPHACTDLLYWTDTQLNNYYYLVQFADIHGNVSEFSEERGLENLSGVGEIVPASFSLAQNHPNPFNPITKISFGLPREMTVSLCVYDITGRLVDVLLDQEVTPQGRNEVFWQGCDQAGRQLPSGTYFYRLEAGGYVETKRMTLLK